MAEELHNPKLDEHPGSNTEKNPHDWVSGDDPMTGAQASYLTTLCKEAGEELPPESLTKAEASQRIDEIGRAHVRNPVTNAHLVCRPQLETQKTRHTQHRLHAHLRHIYD